jgi:acyl-coenzyme A thioesterase PaaI-like protein
MTTSPDIHEEPARGRTAEVGLLRLSGIDQLLAGIQGRTPAPPIHHLTGLRPSEAGIGRSTFTMPATEWLQNPIGIFPGGVLAFLADAPLGGALSTGLPPGKILTTSELSMSFLRPASPRSTMLIGRAVPDVPLGGRERIDQHPVAASVTVLGAEVHRSYPLM